MTGSSLRTYDDVVSDFMPDTVYPRDEWNAMQVFVPLPDIEASVQALDVPRLGKQRVEALQMLSSLAGKSAGWLDHPAARMWAGYEQGLLSYAAACCLRVRSLGWVDHVLEQVYERQADFGHLIHDPPLPPWWGGPVHASHRARLIVKEHYRGEGSHYADLWPDDYDHVMSRVERGTITQEQDAEYVWPISPWNAEVKRRPRVPSRADLERHLRTCEARRRDLSLQSDSE